MSQPSLTSYIPCPSGHVGQTFEGMRNVAVREEDQMGFGDASFTFKDREGVIEAVHVNRDDFQGSRYDARTYEKSRWCYDTPGVVNPAQVSSRRCWTHIDVNRTSVYIVECETEPVVDRNGNSHLLPFSKYHVLRY